MKTPGSGRQKGTPNKSTAEVRAMAQAHGPAAIDFWAGVLNDTARTFDERHLAARELVDRGYGKATREINVQVQVSNAWAGLSLAEIADRAEQLAIRARHAADAEARALLPEHVDAVLIEKDAEPAL